MFRSLSHSVSRLIHSADPGIATAKAQWIPRAVHHSHGHAHSHTLSTPHHTTTTYAKQSVRSALFAPELVSPRAQTFANDYEDADNDEYNEQWYDFSVNSDSVSFPLYTRYLRQSRRRFRTDHPSFLLAYLWKHHREGGCEAHKNRKLAAMKRAVEDGAMHNGFLIKLIADKRRQIDAEALTAQSTEDAASSSSYTLQPIDAHSVASSSAIDFAVIGRSENDEKNNDHVRLTMAATDADALPVSVNVTVDGTTYNGDVLSGTQHGRGVMSYANGDVYNGEWEFGLMHGNGRMLYGECCGEYDGQWAKGERHGVGIFRTPTETYIGEWVRNDRHGHGQLFVSNVLVYDGDWANNQRSGFGIALYSEPQSAVYIGQWADGLMNGHGIMLNADGNRWEGRWTEGRWTAGHQNTGVALSPLLKPIRVQSAGAIASPKPLTSTVAVSPQSSAPMAIDSALSTMIDEVSQYQRRIDTRLNQMRSMLQTVNVATAEVM